MYDVIAKVKSVFGLDRKGPKTDTRKPVSSQLQYISYLFQTLDWNLSQDAISGYINKQKDIASDPEKTTWIFVRVLYFPSCLHANTFPIGQVTNLPNRHSSHKLCLRVDYPALYPLSSGSIFTPVITSSYQHICHVCQPSAFRAPQFVPCPPPYVAYYSILLSLTITVPCANLPIWCLEGHSH